MISDAKYLKELERLKNEHKSIENEVFNLMKCKVINQFRLVNLKKKKARIIESISSLQTILYRDITA